MYSEYYIGTGELNKMYTLRHQFDKVLFYRMGDDSEQQSAIVRHDHYLQNLSTDKSRAVEKAKMLGFDVSEPEFSLLEIQRRKKEHDDIVQEAIYEDEVSQQTLKEKEQEEIALIKRSRFPFGKNKGVAFEALRMEKGDLWVEYWIKNNESDSPVEACLGEQMAIDYPCLAALAALPDNGNDLYFGEVQSRYEREVIFIRQASFRSNAFGKDIYVQKFLTLTGELLVYKGTSPNEYVRGEKYDISFAVKEHATYKEVNQTHIFRIWLLPAAQKLPDVRANRPDVNLPKLPDAEFLSGSEYLSNQLKQFAFNSPQSSVVLCVRNFLNVDYGLLNINSEILNVKERGSDLVSDWSLDTKIAFVETVLLGLPVKIEMYSLKESVSGLVRKGVLVGSEREFNALRDFAMGEFAVFNDLCFKGLEGGHGLIPCIEVVEYLFADKVLLDAHNVRCATFS